MRTKEPLSVGENWKKFCLKKRAGKKNNTNIPNKNKTNMIKPNVDKIDTVVVLSGGERVSQQKYVAVDCEMIGIGKQGSISFVARVSIVNSKGKVLYDKFVKPDAHVTDYRTEVSGIRPHDLSKGLTFETVQDDVGKIFSISEIVVGHTILNDLNCLKIKLRQSQLRDIAYCSHLKELAQMGSQRVIGLRSLASSLLSMSIQTGEHSSVQDAIATMQLYMLVKDRCTKKCAPKYK